VTDRLDSRGRLGKGAGLTLLEVLTVIGILSVLVAAAAVGYSYLESTAQRDACRDNMQSIQKELQVFKLQHGRYPYRGPGPVYPGQSQEFSAFLRDRKYFRDRPTCPSDRTRSVDYNYTRPEGAEAPVIRCPIHPSEHGAL